MYGRADFRMAPQVGLEPTTLRLTAGCSAIELLRSVALRGITSLNISFRGGDGNGFGFLGGQSVEFRCAVNLQR